MRRILEYRFFNRPTPQVAKDLLGKFLVRPIGRRNVALMITETEAYDGFKDRGSHAHRGRTKRNWPMFGPPGHWYVYYTYGTHWMLNIATRETGYPGAVLIRAGSLFSNSRELENKDLVNGPGRLTKALKITGALNGKPAVPRSELWIAASNPLRRASRLAQRESERAPRFVGAGRQRKLKIKKGPRVGIAYAGPYWAKRHWRFWINKSTS
ncbi:MAG: DNA-3-methyladenine glycosylase [Patescibacteria group bacterium]|mgnify:CR=1 FL=1